MKHMRVLLSNKKSSKRPRRLESKGSVADHLCSYRRPVPSQSSSLGSFQTHTHHHFKHSKTNEEVLYNTQTKPV